LHRLPFGLVDMAAEEVHRLGLFDELSYCAATGVKAVMDAV
jgi:hypothetical protein